MQRTAQYYISMFARLSLLSPGGSPGATPGASWVVGLRRGLRRVWQGGLSGGSLSVGGLVVLLGAGVGSGGAGCAGQTPTAARDAGRETSPEARRATAGAATAAGLVACCQQCLAGSERDPAGYDLSPVPCGKYRDSGAVDASCAGLLSANAATVGSCRGVTARGAAQ